MHLLLTHIMIQLKDSAPQMFHKCPYNGELNLTNVTINDKKGLDSFPEGFYKISFFVSDVKFNELLLVNLFTHGKSMFLKDSFG